MVIKNVALETVCGITSTFPENDKMEVAFAGKSNVGKSSLINAIMNRKSLARTSAQPGKTQTVNYYNVNDVFYLVDLPGYGYANANVEVKAQRRFKQNQEKGIDMSYEEVLDNIKKRDKNDMEKEMGALKVADDAVIIDNTDLTIEETFEKFKILINEKIK